MRPSRNTRRPRRQPSGSVPLRCRRPWPTWPAGRGWRARPVTKARGLAAGGSSRPAGQPAGQRRGPLAGLTGRELEVLRLLAAGQSNKEIGAELFIATKTASVHVSNILAKLGAASRTEAAAIAHGEGLGRSGPQDNRSG